MAILSSKEVKMTAILEKIVAIIAPHHCFVCSKEDNVICLACLADLCPGLDSVCVFCGEQTEMYRPCQACSAQACLKRVWATAQYKGLVADLIGALKFERKKAAYKPLAQALEATVSFLPIDTMVVPIPTAPQRIRQRGYDQAQLIAKDFADMRHLAFVSALARSASARQVGADREQRLEQTKNMFSVRTSVKNKNILLIDDVCTTGATLKAAAAVLQAAGAREVSAAVIAWAPPK